MTLPTPLAKELWKSSSSPRSIGQSKDGQIAVVCETAIYIFIHSFLSNIGFSSKWIIIGLDKTSPWSSDLDTSSNSQNGSSNTDFLRAEWSPGVGNGIPCFLACLRASGSVIIVNEAIRRSHNDHLQVAHFLSMLGLDISLDFSASYRSWAIGLGADQKIKSLVWHPQSVPILANGKLNSLLLVTGSTDYITIWCLHINHAGDPESSNTHILNSFILGSVSLFDVGICTKDAGSAITCLLSVPITPVCGRSGVVSFFVICGSIDGSLAQLKVTLSRAENGNVEFEASLLWKLELWAHSQVEIIEYCVKTDTLVSVAGLQVLVTSLDNHHPQVMQGLHSHSVTEFSTLPYLPHFFVSSSMDGQIKVWDTLGADGALARGGYGGPRSLTSENVTITSKGHKHMGLCSDPLGLCLGYVRVIPGLQRNTRKSQCLPDLCRTHCALEFTPAPLVASADVAWIATSEGCLEVLKRIVLAADAGVVVDRVSWAGLSVAAVQSVEYIFAHQDKGVANVTADEGNDQILAGQDIKSHMQDAFSSSSIPIINAMAKALRSLGPSELELYSRAVELLYEAAGVIVSLIGESDINDCSMVELGREEERSLIHLFRYGDERALTLRLWRALHQLLLAPSRLIELKMSRSLTLLYARDAEMVRSAENDKIRFSNMAKELRRFILVAMEIGSIEKLISQKVAGVVVTVESADHIETNDPGRCGIEALHGVVANLSPKNFRSLFLMTQMLIAWEQLHSCVICMTSPCFSSSPCPLPLLSALSESLSRSENMQTPELCILCGAATPLLFDPATPEYSKCSHCGELLDRCCISLRLVTDDLVQEFSVNSILQCSLCEAVALREPPGSDDMSWLWFNDNMPLCPYCMILMSPIM